MELDGDAASVGNLEDAWGWLVEVGFVVGGIAGDDEVVGLGEFDGLVVEVEGGDGAGGVVGVVEVEEFGAAADVGWDGVEVR